MSEPLGVEVGLDREGLDFLQLAEDELGRVHQLAPQAQMGEEQQADQWIPPGGRALAGRGPG